MAALCAHLDQVRDVAPRTPRGCEECLQTNRRYGMRQLVRRDVAGFLAQ